MNKQPTKFRKSLLIGILALVALLACETKAADNPDSAVAHKITVTEFTKSAAGEDSTRPYYISVMLSSTIKGDYRLALRAATAAAPTAEEIRASNATYKFTIDTTAIKVLLTFNMDGTLFDDATKIPESITDLQDGADISNAFNATRLSPSTSYKLYIATEATDSKEVYTDALWTFATDAAENTTLSYPVTTIGDSTTIYTHNKQNPIFMPYWGGQTKAQAFVIMKNGKAVVNAFGKDCGRFDPDVGMKSHAACDGSLAYLYSVNYSGLHDATSFGVLASIGAVSLLYNEFFPQ